MFEDLEEGQTHYLTDIELNKLKQNIGFLRQWLNERPADMLVTNEQIEDWLFNFNK